MALFDNCFQKQFLIFKNKKTKTPVWDGVFFILVLKNKKLFLCFKNRKPKTAERCFISFCF